jgi:hypothetical protein
MPQNPAAVVTLSLLVLLAPAFARADSPGELHRTRFFDLHLEEKDCLQAGRDIDARIASISEHYRLPAGTLAATTRHRVDCDGGENGGCADACIVEFNSTDPAYALFRTRAEKRKGDRREEQCRADAEAFLAKPDTLAAKVRDATSILFKWRCAAYAYVVLPVAD